MTPTKVTEENHRLLFPQAPAFPTPYLPRPRLHQLLDQTVAAAPISALVAPAASGKTTALVGWRQAGAELPLQYLALDTLDNDPAWFWSRLLAALQAHDPESSGEADPDLVEDPRRFLKAIGARSSQPPPAALVLDGVDAVTNPAVLDLLDTLLIDLPAGLRVVLASRGELPVRHGLLRARGQLADVPAEHLPFTVDETAVLLSEATGNVVVDADEAVRLHDRTGGWVGAVKLATLALADHPDPVGYIRDLGGTNRHIADLLQSEVVDDLDPDSRELLLAISVLDDDFEAALADAVAGTAGTVKLLDGLVRTGAFVDLTEGQPRRFRLQRMLREFLRHQLHLAGDERWRTANRAAAVWYQDGGHMVPAMRHLQAAGDYDAVLGILLEHGPRLAASGHVTTVQEWLRTVPDDVVTDDMDQLLAVARLCVMTGLRAEASMWIERARWRLPPGRHDTASDTASVTGSAIQLALLQGYSYAQVGRLENAVEQCSQALVLAERSDPNPGLLAMIHHVLGAAYSGLDMFTEAEIHRRAAHDAASGDDMASAAYPAWLSYREGALTRAAELATELLSQSRLPWQWTTALVARGGARRERNQVDAAEADLLATVALAEEWSRPVTGVFAQIELALLRFAEGRPAAAYDALAAARGQTEGPMLRSRIDVTEAALRLREGDGQQAALLRANLPPSADSALLDIRLAVAAGRVDEATSLLAGFASAALSTQDKIVAHLLEARIRATVDEPAASDHLRQAIDLGRSEGFVQVFLDDLPHLDHLVRSLAAPGDDPYLVGLRAVLVDAAHSPSSSDRLTEGLSTREQVVLRYLPTSLSYQAIADELHMSVNTLKTHLKSINRKLAARSRADAVSIARSMHLI